MIQHHRFELSVPVGDVDHLLGPSHAPATLAEAAGGQGKFWPMHDLLFENQRHLKLNQLRGYAERLELDMARYDADMHEQTYLQRVRAHPAADAVLVRDGRFAAVGAIADVQRHTKPAVARIDGFESASGDA